MTGANSGIGKEVGDDVTYSLSMTDFAPRVYTEVLRSPVDKRSVRLCVLLHVLAQVSKYLASRGGGVYMICRNAARAESVR